MTEDYVLYLLIRKDMDSFNHVGKMIAQGAHAANHAAHLIGAGKFGTERMQQFSVWEKQTAQGFGTTIVLGGTIYYTAYSVTPDRIGFTIDEIRRIVDLAVLAGFAAAVTIDPGYPLQDGKTMHALPCETVAWIFGSKTELYPIIGKLALHPAETTFKVLDNG